MTGFEMTAIHWHSTLNEWMDCMVIVPTTMAESAQSIIQQAIEAYWMDKYECYGDAITQKLQQVGIPYLISYIDWDDVYDEPVPGWNWDWVEIPIVEVVG